MKLSFVIVAAAVLLTFAGCDVLESVSNSGETPTNAEIVEGLKEALKIGAQEAADGLSQVGGYSGNELYKILLPPEADTIVTNISHIPGGQGMLNDVIARINAAAEDAAKEAAPIFTTAITSMTVSDAMGILKGSNDTAATEYLKDTTGDALKNVFKEPLDNALQAPIIAGVSAENSWNTLKSANNTIANTIVGQIAGMQTVNTNLNDYVLDKALYALFNEVGEAEKSIRANPMEYASAIVKKVFSFAKK
jgi:hypothetical protein